MSSDDAIYINDIHDYLFAYGLDIYTQPTLGKLDQNNNFHDVDVVSLSPLLLGVTSGELLQPIEVTITTAEGTIEVFLPELTGHTEIRFLVYVADDGSTYYADDENDGFTTWATELLPVGDAMVEDHFARGAE
jgi:hypothetical protein